MMAGYYSFGHEIGHNIGADHNPEVARNKVYPYGYGHLIQKVHWLRQF